LKNIFGENIFLKNIFCENIFLTNIFGKYIFDENIFTKNIFEKIFSKNIFGGNIFVNNIFGKNIFFFYPSSWLPYKQPLPLLSSSSVIFEVECDTTNELTDRTDTMIVPFIVLDIFWHSHIWPNNQGQSSKVCGHVVSNWGHHGTSHRILHHQWRRDLLFCNKNHCKFFKIQGRFLTILMCILLCFKCPIIIISYHFSYSHIR